MHIQARAQPSRSPADLAEFLGFMSDASQTDGPINIEGVTGSAVEHGGHLVFVVAHGREADCNRVLRDAGYRCQWTTDLYAERIPPDEAQGSAELAVSTDDPNQPGVLEGIIQRAKGSGIAAGRPIHEVLIGAFTDEPGHFFAQVTFQGARWEDRPPRDGAID
jgi:hypothetical protein